MAYNKETMEKNWTEKMDQYSGRQKGKVSLTKPIN